MNTTQKNWFFYRNHLRRIEDRADKIYITKHRIHFPYLLKIFIRQIKKDNIQERASSMAFNFTLSIFPFIIFLFTLIPYIPIPNLKVSIMEFLADVMPPSMYAVAENTIVDIINIPHGGLLSFGFLFALFTATNGVRAMTTAFNKCYRTAENRSFLKRTWISFYLVFFISMTIFISIAIGIFSKIYLDKLEMGMYGHSHSSNVVFLYILKNTTLFIIFFVTVSLIYFIAPTVSVRWSFFSFGSFIASAIGMIFTLLFSYFTITFNSYNKIYGSIGAFIGVMIWLYAISIVLLVGFEVNASIDFIKNQKSKNNK